MQKIKSFLWPLSAWIFCLAMNTGSRSNARETINLATAEIIIESGDEVQVNAGKYLQEQIDQRTGIQLKVRGEMPVNPVPVIELGLETDLIAPRGISVPAREESFAIWVDTSNPEAPLIRVSGRDNRGILFGAGRLLQELYLSSDYISIPTDLAITSAPADRIRAHQIITNTQCEDGFLEWDKESDVRQFVNDMIIFGTNGFEPTVPELVDEYLENLGIELFVKLKCQEIIDLDSKTDEEIISSFAHLEGIDHITTYGGDASGSVRPDLFFPHMERVLPLILKGEPGVKWWYSNQCLDDHALDYDEYIFNYFRKNKPSYLYGMVYGPWTKRGIPEIREDLPSQYEIRHFPETCHPRWCQYPVPGWDRSFAIVWPRNQSIYMMPSMMLDVYKAGRKHTLGSLPYNHTGVYNDLNKFVWSAAGWNPEIEVDSILSTYAKVFIAHDFIRYPGQPDQPKSNSPEKNNSPEEIIHAATKSVLKGLKLLEQNWTGLLKNNSSAEAALKQWELIADCIGGAEKNWRVEMFLCKARIDAQVKRKYDLEMQAEMKALVILETMGKSNLKMAIRDARTALAEADKGFQSREDFLQECRDLGISEKFGDLGLITDNLYTSLNDRIWIEERLEKVLNYGDILKIIHYEDPGEGGFYDNLGVMGEQPHLVRQFSWKDDPGFIHSPIEWVDNKANSNLRHSQHTHALCRYSNPLIMRWEDLDKNSQYEIRVVYNGPFDSRIKCRTDEEIIIHDYIEKEGGEILTFNIPGEASKDGTLELQWTIEDDDIARGVSVSEIWLSKTDQR